MIIFVSGSQITYENGSIEIREEQRTKTLSFSAFSKYSDYSEVEVYSANRVSSVSGSDIYISFPDNSYLDYHNLYRENEYLFAHLGGEREKRAIQGVSYSGNTLKLTLSSVFTVSPSVGDYVGKLEFGGHITDTRDSQISPNGKFMFEYECLDYTRIFDMKLLNDTYTDKDARYIINDFCNITINKNAILDSMEYADSTAVQSAYSQGGTATNRTWDSSDYREGTGSVKFAQTVGTATFTKTITSTNLSEYLSLSGGNPTSGVLGFWSKTSGSATITVKVGNDASNYFSYAITQNVASWIFNEVKFKDMTETGSVDFTAIDYLSFSIVSSGTITTNIDGVRVFEDQFFRHYPFVNESIIFDEFNIKRKKPTEIMGRIADELNWYWYIDSERYIHLFPETENEAPFECKSSDNTFSSLEFTFDTTRLYNRVMVEGGNQTSTSFYYEIKQGDGITKEWITKNKFKNLEISVDKNTSTDTMEAGTNTTSVTATAHGLSSEDHIVNRTRGEVRQITVTSANSFDIIGDPITGQTSGDTFSKFVVATIGIEGIAGETPDFLYNFNEKSIRNSENNPPYIAGEYIRFKYNEVIPILVQQQESASISSMRSIIGYGEGIFDAEPIIDRNISSRAEAIQYARAFLQKYSNTIITATIRTNYHGLRVGQYLYIQDTRTGRSVDKRFIVQSLTRKQIEGKDSNISEYTVSCSSLLFGMIELLQQLLRQKRSIEIDSGEIIDNIVDIYEEIGMSDVLSFPTPYEILESVGISDTIQTVIYSPPFVWQPYLATTAKWNLAEWS